MGSELSFSGGKKEFYPAASTWLASGLPGLKQHPTIYFQGESQESEPAFLLSNAEHLIQQAQALAAPFRGHIYSESVGSGTYIAGVSVERESVLMLKSTYHPNWRAYVDGAESETTMLMPSYIGVEISLGDHVVRMEYRSRSLRSILLGRWPIDSSIHRPGRAAPSATRRLDDKFNLDPDR